MHYSSSGSKHGGSHGSLGEVSVYEQRRQQRDEARKDFWNHTLDLLGTASAQAGRGITGISVPVEQQLEESRRQIENVRAIREANARFEATRQPIEWDGRAELISALEQLDMQSGWEINEEQANAAEQQRQELLARLREGDLAAGNGERSGTDADTGRDVVEGTAKGIAGAGVNLVSNLGKLLEKTDAYFWKPTDWLSDLVHGQEPGTTRQSRIDAYNNPESQEKWQDIDAIADSLDNDAAAVLRRAKEGKSIVGEMGVDVAKGVLEAGFDAGLAAVTGGSALVPMAARVYGQSVGTARRAGATPEQQAAYGLTSAAIEVASEMLFDGVAKIYGAGAADDIVEKLVVELADSDTGRSMLRFLAGAAGEGAEEVVSDLLSPLAEATYRGESLAELYRQLEPADLLYDYLIGASVSILASGASAATRQSGEASAEYRANEAEYFNILERKGLLPPENGKNAVHEGAANADQNNMSESHSKTDVSGLQLEGEKDIMVTKMAETGGRRNEISLSSDQLADVEREVGVQGYKSDVVYSDYESTSFIGFPDGACLLIIGTDAYPSESPKNANEALPMKASIAHEIVGHYESWLRGTVQQDRVLDEAQASIRAARFAEALTDEERDALMQDAFFRLKKAGLSFEDIQQQLDIEER